MSKENDNRTSPSRRLVRAGSILFYVLLGGWIVWLGLTRWHGTPADPSGAKISGVFGPSLPIDPAWDRTEVLTAALAAIPALPTWTPPSPPPGMRWSRQPSSPIDPIDALSGEWTPETRPHLQAVIEYLQTPAVEAALAQLAAIEPGGWRPLDPQGPGLGGLIALRGAARLFVARARWHHTARADIDSALANLEGACLLAAIAIDSGENTGTFVGIGCQASAVAELRRMTCEQDLTPAQAAQVRACLARATVGRADMWLRVTDTNIAKLYRTVELCWSDDGQNNGWLVLSRLDHIWPPIWSQEPRCGTWNLASPLFNNRQTVVEKIRRLEKAYELVPALPYREARASLEANAAFSVFNLTDGPLVVRWGSQRSHAYQAIVRLDADRSACFVTSALSAYRHERGHYPKTLRELLDGYVDTMPLDPYVGEPFRYQLDGEQFLLYSVGPNNTDDGGKTGEADGTTSQSTRHDDLGYTLPRDEPYREPKLEKLKP